jgi:hypothetical protein
MFHYVVSPAFAPHCTEDRNQMDANAYRLSRIYGQGWKAAKEMLLDHPEGLEAKSTAPANPHETLEERARWSQGFEDALNSSTSARGSANIGSWRPSQRGNAWKPSRNIRG